MANHDLLQPMDITQELKIREYAAIFNEMARLVDNGDIKPDDTEASIMQKTARALRDSIHHPQDIRNAIAMVSPPPCDQEQPAQEPDAYAQLEHFKKEARKLLEQQRAGYRSFLDHEKSFLFLLQGADATGILADTCRTKVHAYERMIQVLTVIDNLLEDIKPLKSNNREQQADRTTPN